MNKQLEKLPETLLRLRQEKGASQREVADAIGITYSVLSNYEKGIKSPSLDFAVRLADYYGVGLDELCGRANSSTSNIKKSFVTLYKGIGSQELKIEDVLWEDSKELNDDPDFNPWNLPNLDITTKRVTWIIHNTELARFMELYKQISGLVESGQLDADVLDVWLEKQFSAGTSAER